MLRIIHQLIAMPDGPAFEIASVVSDRGFDLTWEEMERPLLRVVTLGTLFVAGLSQECSDLFRPTLAKNLEVIEAMRLLTDPELPSTLMGESEETIAQLSLESLQVLLGSCGMSVGTYQELIELNDLTADELEMITSQFEFGRVVLRPLLDRVVLIAEALRQTDTTTIH